MIWMLTAATAAPVDSLRDRLEDRADERFEQRLDTVAATPGQRTALTELRDGWKAQRDTFREEGQGLRAELRDLLLAETVDARAVERARKELVDLFDRSTAFAVGQLVRAAEVLTPEQRAALRAHAPGK